MFAYPIGLALVLTAAALELYRPWLGIGSLALLGWPVFLLVRHRAVATNVWVLTRRPLAWGSPAALALAVALGAYFHGPGPGYDSGAGGDVAFYAGRIEAARHSLFPFWDLAVAGRHLTYAEVGPSAIGAVLSHVPGFDPFLFGAVTLPLAAMMSILVGIAIVGRPQQQVSGFNVVLVTTLAVAMVHYGSWLVDSSPVTLSLPLAFVLWSLYQDPRSLRSLIAWSALLGALCLFTKVLVLIPLGVLLAAVLLRDHRRLLRGWRLLVFLGCSALLVGAFVAALAVTASWFTRVLHPYFSTAHNIRSLRNVNWTTYAPAGQLLNDLGVAFLCVGLVRARRYAIAVAAALPVLWFQLVTGINVQVAIGVAVLIAAIDLWIRPTAPELRAWFAAASLLLAAAVVVRDISPLRTSMVFDLLLAATVAAGLTATLPAPRLFRISLAALGPAVAFALAGRGVLAFVAPFALVYMLALVRSPRFGVRPTAIAGICLVLVALVGATVVAIHRDNFRLRAHTTVKNARPIVSRDDWDAWHFVKTKTDPRSLVFTSLTGRVVDDWHGWNYYPMLGARQVYIAGWFNSELKVNDSALIAQLDANRDVLSGRRRGCDVPDGRSFRPYYAVLQRGEHAPPRARLVHETASRLVYRLPDCNGAA